jgi:hypothetical protein
LEEIIGEGRKWLKKAVVCRKEILAPKVKETEGKLKGRREKGEKRISNIEQGISNDEANKRMNLEVRMKN